MGERQFDAIVLGAGAPGEVCAGRLADGGLEVGIVEQHLVVGECSYYACMPSKALLGGGPVGSELAQAWAALGAKITLIEGEARLLSREEPFAGEQVAEALREKHGVDVRTGVLAQRVADRETCLSSTTHQGAQAQTRRVVVELDDGTTVEVAEILVAVGRKPRTEHIGLDSVGVEPGNGGFLETDDHMRVGNHDWLYAVGDVNGRALFTHIGKYQAWVAAENALGREVEAVAEGLGAPRVTFTDPQVAAVGKTLAQARDAGIEATAVDVPTDGTAGASFQGKDTGGTSRLVIDEAHGTIVGATFTGFETADFLHAAAVAIVGKVPLSQLRHAVAAYPTRSEVWLKLLEAYGL